jgi:hypothetical protein
MPDPSHPFDNPMSPQVTTSRPSIDFLQAEYSAPTPRLTSKTRQSQSSRIPQQAKMITIIYLIAGRLPLPKIHTI